MDANLGFSQSHLRKSYRIILGVKQVEVHMKNDELYKKVSQYPIRDQIRERQLKFTGHCLRMDKEELAYIYIFYKSEIRQNKRGRANTNYHDQISTSGTSGTTRTRRTARSSTATAAGRTPRACSRTSTTSKTC